VTDQTGLRSAASDVTEGPTGDSWVSPLSVTADQIYLMVVDNYSESYQPYTLSWTLTNGATLDCTPLPVEFGKISGFSENRINYIFWTTFSEINNDYFVLKRSVDGVNWESIQTVNAVGNSTQETNYFIQDYDFLLNNLNYYRISQVDIDGKNKDLGTITIDNFTSSKRIANRFNLLGQEVNEDFKGFIILELHDGSLIKTFQN